MTTLLKNGYLVDPMNKRSGQFDLLIKDGVIEEVAPGLSRPADRLVDCGGLAVLPGLFDMHVHFRDPGQTHKEDMATGSEAAAAGGVTGVLCMPNTLPVVGTAETAGYVLDKAKKAKIRIYHSCAVTRGFGGEKLCEFDALRELGIIAVTEDGRPVADARLMGEAMVWAKRLGMPVISHCEDLGIIGGGIINEGRISQRLGVKGMSRLSENIITGRELDLAETLDAPIHIAHVSTKEAVRKIREAKRRGVRVTCETAPHYFTFCEDMLLRQDADYRMNPPLRELEDVLEVARGVMDGTIDCIVTDHAPHSPEEKADFLTAPNGVIGLETSLAATLTMLYHLSYLTIEQVVRLMCVSPRKILGISGGGLGKGAAADIAVVDLNEEWVVDPYQMKSKSRNSCFKGMKLKGRVKRTFVGGDEIYTD